jgi:diguanylate cyclase (GGDEF)-like protein
MRRQAEIPADLVSMLDQLARTIVSTLGFDAAVIHLARPDGELEAVSVIGSAGSRTPLLGTTSSEALWDQWLTAGEPMGRLRFLHHHSPQGSPVAAGGDPGDALLAPLTASDGSRLGVLAVNLPGGLRRPDLATRSALEAFAISASMAIEHATMRSLAEASEQRFRKKAMSDPLTGIGTRALLLERLRHASTARSDLGGVMALAFIDLDDFKAINDDHSHAVGDHVLRTLAQRIQTAVRAHDTVARWGGDEFLVLLHPLSDEHAALGVVQRILAAVAEPITDLDNPVKVTASIGISFWTAAAPVEVEELVRRADAAMYEAKRRGANDFAVFDDFDAEASRRLHVLDLLSRAVNEERVVVHYQPIVRVSDGSVVGVEALLRLRDDDALIHPFELLDRGAPPPDVTREILHRATEQVSRWTAQGHDLSLSVNVTAQQVADIDVFVGDVGRILGETGLGPERLVLGLTEHALLSTTPRTLEGIDALVRTGVRFSVDDFGTGYGSMTYVHVMPVHELKIDRSFVSGAGNERTATAIIRSIVTLASELEIDCVAEGVDSLARHEVLRELGVQLAQGDHYSPPVDAASLGDLLDEVAGRGRAQVPGGSGGRPGKG